MEKRTCEQCGEVFKPWNNVAPGRFCSVACANDSKVVRVLPKNCAQCGASFTRRCSERPGAFAVRQYCSRDCRANACSQRMQQPKRTILCKTCGKEVHIKPSQRMRQYCDMNCRRADEQRMKSPRFSCAHCGELFYRVPARPGRYCSEACQYAAGRLNLECNQCGKSFTRQRARVWRGGGRYCSRQCVWDAAFGRVLKSDEPAKWKREYPRGFNRTLKIRIKQRDGHACQWCGNSTKRLAVHHIDYVKSNIDPMNLITLCCTCHNKTNFNRQSWPELLRPLVRGLTLVAQDRR